ncbi:hypothetical protein DACRYDRAFT_20690 [Dacryopinax primogenitus]|uniref:Uncharacterized protein n=1 Tax=Dacryopinax primogenitus (strain DJM 731) TaxID=1858805 RepID=M5G5L2_DACPD|nr:uncharacterized protein DACRYDRAFT_20690 [Dacryopinax primogenitus]EJU03989.1 hypothetical protein DACRYDRAFT_20690 [Dacryopinax primogenitus]
MERFFLPQGMNEVLVGLGILPIVRPKGQLKTPAACTRRQADFDAASVDRLLSLLEKESLLANWTLFARETAFQTGLELVSSAHSPEEQEALEQILEGAWGDHVWLGPHLDVYEGAIHLLYAALRRRGRSYAREPRFLAIQCWENQLGRQNWRTHINLHDWDASRSLPLRLGPSVSPAVRLQPFCWPPWLSSEEVPLLGCPSFDREFKFLSDFLIKGFCDSPNDYTTWVRLAESYSNSKGRTLFTAFDSPGSQRSDDPTPLMATSRTNFRLAEDRRDRTERNNRITWEIHCSRSPERRTDSNWRHPSREREAPAIHQTSSG